MIWAIIALTLVYLWTGLFVVKIIDLGSPPGEQKPTGGLMLFLDGCIVLAWPVVIFLIMLITFLVILTPVIYNLRLWRLFSFKWFYGSAYKAAELFHSKFMKPKSQAEKDK